MNVNQPTLEELEIEEPETQDQLQQTQPGNKLACCSLYERCSDLGKCLQSDPYYLNCAYRQNLENGKIFYSDKSNLFSAERYEYICKYFNSLPPEEQCILGDVIYHFAYVKRGTRSCLCIYDDDLHRILENFKAFNLMEPLGVTFNLFRYGVILNKSARKFHNLHSRFPEPVFPEKKKGENFDGLQIWKMNFLKDLDVMHALSQRFIGIEINDYSFELDRFFRENINLLPKGSGKFAFLCPYTIKDFKSHLFD